MDLTCIVAIPAPGVDVRTCLQQVVGHHTVVVDDTNCPLWAELTRSYGFEYRSHPQPRGLAACWAHYQKTPLAGRVAFLNAANVYPEGGLAQLNLRLDESPELDACLAWTSRGRRYALETMVCRSGLLEGLAPPHSELGWLAEAQWFLQAELAGAQLAFVNEVSILLAPPGPDRDWQAEWLRLTQLPEPAHEAYFELPPGRVRLRVQERQLFDHWCLAWKPYGCEAGSSALEIDVFCDPGNLWVPDDALFQLPPRQQCQGLMSDWKSPILVSQRPGLGMLYRPDAARVLGRLRAPQDLSETDLGKPLELAMLGWLAETGRAACHATVVAWQGQGVLLIGPENSGKSTAMAACLQAGWDFVADDLVVLQGCVAQGLYASAWFQAEQRERFVELLGGLRSSALEPKGWLPMAEVLPAARLLREATLQAVVWLRPGTPWGLQKASRGSLMRELVGALSRVSGMAGPHRLEVAHQLVSSCSCWELRAGPDMERIPEWLNRALNS